LTTEGQSQRARTSSKRSSHLFELVPRSKRRSLALTLGGKCVDSLFISRKREVIMAEPRQCVARKSVCSTLEGARTGPTSLQAARSGRIPSEHTSSRLFDPLASAHCALYLQAPATRPGRPSLFLDATSDVPWWDRRWGELGLGAQRAQRGQRLQREVTNTPRLTRLRSRSRCPPGCTIPATPLSSPSVPPCHRSNRKALLDVSTRPCASSPAPRVTCSELCHRHKLFWARCWPPGGPVAGRSGRKKKSGVLAHIGVWRAQTAVFLLPFR
jgi:hypothetical protein